MEKKRSREHRRPSPERQSKSKTSSRKSSPNPIEESEDPSQWKIIPPSEVDVSPKRFAQRFLQLFAFLFSISVLLLFSEVKDGKCHLGSLVL